MQANICLADGLVLGLCAEDTKAQGVLCRLSRVMRLGTEGDPERRLLIFVAKKRGEWTSLPYFRNGVARCLVSPARDADADARTIQLMQIALAISLLSEERGGLLLHGALIKRDGGGVILAGPGGVGKTTACRRLQPPWYPLSDDATLVVCDGDGKYWAHPWPTWSALTNGGDGRSWDVQGAVPLRGIFLLSKAPKILCDPLGQGEICTRLMLLSEQTTGGLLKYLDRKEIRQIRMRRFENICALSKIVPCYHLRLNLVGAFWKEIESVVG